MIQGIEIKELKVIKDSRGFLMEMLRADDKIFQKFGQVYMTFCRYGVAKAWHYHKLQDDHFIALAGKTLVGLYDAREKSKTFGQIQKFVMVAPENSDGRVRIVPTAVEDSRSKIGTGTKGGGVLFGCYVLKIPKGVYHGFAALTKNGSKVLNVPTKTYNYKKPDEYRLAWNTKEIKFNWPVFIHRGG